MRSPCVGWSSGCCSGARRCGPVGCGVVGGGGTVTRGAHPPGGSAPTKGKAAHSPGSAFTGQRTHHQGSALTEAATLGSPHSPGQRTHRVAARARRRPFARAGHPRRTRCDLRATCTGGAARTDGAREGAEWAADRLSSTGRDRGRGEDPAGSTATRAPTRTGSHPHARAGARRAQGRGRRAQDRRRRTQDRGVVHRRAARSPGGRAQNIPPAQRPSLAHPL